MELKRILARDARSANEKAIQTYGSDVLVISTQRIGDQIELIVAVEAQSGAVSESPKAPSAEQSGAELRQEKAEVFAEIFGFVQRQESARTADRAGVSVPPADASSTGPEEASVEVPPIPEVAVSGKDPHPVQAQAQSQPKAQAKAKPAPKAKPVPKAKAAAPTQRVTKPKAPVLEVRSDDLQREWLRHLECVELLRQEVGVLRREMQLQRQVMPWQAQQDLSPEALAVADELMRLGVPVGLRTLMLDALKTAQGHEGARLALSSVLESHLANCVSSAIEPGVHALVGPSGAGKTSMVVRMAHAMAQVDGPQSQAIISHADLRPGAWSQIQMLASSVGIDVYRAANAQALTVLLEELKPRRHIWIDTASDAHFGRDPALCQAQPGLSWHAVVPLDASATTLRRMQAQMPWQSLMITKADEGFHVWQWLQAFSEQPVPVSMVSCSDAVQLPARAFDPAAWVKQALDDLKLPEPAAHRKPMRATRRVKTTSGKAQHA